MVVPWYHSILFYLKPFCQSTLPSLEKNKGPTIKCKLCYMFYENYPHSYSLQALSEIQGDFSDIYGQFAYHQSDNLREGCPKNID